MLNSDSMNEKQSDLFTQGENYELNLLTISADGRLIVDEHGHIVASNHAASAVFAKITDSLINQHIETLVPTQKPEHRDLLSEEFLEENYHFHIHNWIEMVKSLSSYKGFQFNVSFVDIKGNSYAVVAIRDQRVQTSVVEHLVHAEKVVTRSFLSF